MVGVDWLWASAKEVLISEVCFKEIVSTGEQFNSVLFPDSSPDLEWGSKSVTPFL